MSFGQEVMGVKDKGEGNRAIFSSHISEIAATAGRHQY